MSLLCKLGWHSWPINVPEEQCEYLRERIADLGLVSYCEQTGWQYCERCGEFRFVKRTGIVSMFGGGTASKWRKCTFEEKIESDLLPRL